MHGGGGRAAWRVAKRTLLAKSCIDCGVLHNADQYRKSPKTGYYGDQCRKCKHISAKKADKKSNFLSQAKAINSGLPWTRSDVRCLEEMYAAGESVGVIAEKLGRSRQAVMQAKLKYVKKGN